MSSSCSEIYGEGRAADGNGRPAGIRCRGSADLPTRVGEPGRNRTFNQQIKSLGTSHRTSSQIATSERIGDSRWPRMTRRTDVVPQQCHMLAAAGRGRQPQVGRDSLKRQPFKLEDVVTVDGRPRKTGVGCHASWPTVAHKRGSAAGTRTGVFASMPPSASSGQIVPGANDSCATRGPRSPSNPADLKRVHSARSAGGAGVGTAAVGGHHPACTYQPCASCPTVRALLVLSPREVLTALARLIPPPRVRGHRYLGSLAPTPGPEPETRRQAPPVMTRPRHPHRLRPGPGGRG